MTGQTETDRDRHRQTDRQTGRQADRQTDRQANRQTDRQTDFTNPRDRDRQTTTDFTIEKMSYNTWPKYVLTILIILKYKQDKKLLIGETSNYL
jgi:hypothetical protein